MHYAHFRSHLFANDNDDNHNNNLDNDHNSADSYVHNGTYHHGADNHSRVFDNDIVVIDNGANNDINLFIDDNDLARQ